MTEPIRTFTYSIEPAEPEPPPERTRRKVVLPVALFVATCLSTWLVGGLAFSATLMTILLCHELGHFLQAIRYRVPASLPFFIPMPFSPIGTMGAVIVMRPGIGDRKALFDIAITGPLAGLLPALAASWVGLSWSRVEALPTEGATLTLGEPLIFRAMSWLTFGKLPEGQDILLHPVAFAGWVGLFVTALNLLPIGQLDGGHVLYALLRRKAHPVAQALLFGAALAVVAFGYWGWSLLLLLLFWMGAKHPPTADDRAPLGRVRRVLGWSAFAILVVGFTPEPFRLAPVPDEEPPPVEAPPPAGTGQLVDLGAAAPPFDSVRPESVLTGTRQRARMEPSCLLERRSGGPSRSSPWHSSCLSAPPPPRTGPLLSS